MEKKSRDPELNVIDKESNTKLSAKQRILRLQDLLKRYTDEDHQLTLEQIIERFYQENNVLVGKKAIKDDLKELEDSLLFDVTVNQEKEGVEKYYSHQYRLFEIHELRLLIDAVSSAKFITNEETDNLIKKINKLTSEPTANQLKNRLLLSDAKIDDERVINTIHELHTAIAGNHVIQFQYGKYNINKEFERSKNGEYYKVKPFALIWNNDFYYLIGEYKPKGDIRHYRVDRMRDVSATKETFVPDPSFNVSKYTGMLYHMYSGEESLIEIEFDHHLINVVIDRFGRGINVRPASNQTFRISTQAIISDGLVRWLLTWGSDAKVMTPPSLVQRMKQEAEKLHHKYE